MWGESPCEPDPSLSAGRHNAPLRNNPRLPGALSQSRSIMRLHCLWAEAVGYVWGQAARLRTTKLLCICPRAERHLQPEGSSMVAVGTMHSSSFSHLTAHSSSLALRCKRLTCHRQAIPSTPRQAPSSTVGLLHSKRMWPQRQTAKGTCAFAPKQGLRRHMLVDWFGRDLVQQVARSGPQLGRLDMLYAGFEDSWRVCWGAEAALAAGRFQRQETFILICRSQIAR